MSLITVIWRGHSGTRAISHTLYASNVYMGSILNDSGDLLPPQAIYEACRVIARYIDWRGGLNWNFGALTARQKGVCYGIDMNHRFTPAARLAKKWLDDGRLGHLLFINMSMWIMNPTESSPYFYIKSLHPHTIDVMRYFCGDIDAVQCFATKAPGRTIWSTAQFNFRFKNGVVGHLTGSYDIERGHPMERCEVAGTGGRFVLEDMWRELTLYPAGNLEKTVYSDPAFGGFHTFEGTFGDRIHTFLQQVTEQAAPEDIDGRAADALAAQKVLAAAIESLEKETVVYIKG